MMLIELNCYSRHRRPLRLRGIWPSTSAAIDSAIALGYDHASARALRARDPAEGLRGCDGSCETESGCVCDRTASTPLPVRLAEILARDPLPYCSGECDSGRQPCTCETGRVAACDLPQPLAPLLTKPRKSEALGRKLVAAVSALLGLLFALHVLAQAGVLG